MGKHPSKPIHSYCVLLLMLLGFVAVQESQAALITYNFEGSVGAVSGSVNPFTIGQTVSGSFTYDTSTARSFVDPVNANYNGAVTNLSLTFGSYVVAGTTGDTGIYNNNDVFGDGFWIRSATTGLPINGMSPTDFNLLLQDFSGAALESTALGPLPPASAFGIKTFGLQFANTSVPVGHFHVTGDLTSVTPVPLPAASILFGSGLISFLGYVRQRSQKKMKMGSQSQCVLWATVFLLICSLVPNQTSHASLITFSFDGTLSSVDSPLSGTFTVGQHFSGFYTFESFTPDDDPSSSTGLYRNAVAAFQLSIGSYNASGPVLHPDLAGMKSDIQVNLYQSMDSYMMSAGFSGPASGMPPKILTLALNALPQTLLSDDSLPLFPPSSTIAESQASHLFLGFGPSPLFRSAGISGDITSLTVVPLPASAVLFPTGLTLLAAMVRRLRK